ncbi:MAG: helix-turn-helix domain-containing protein, partial [Flavobacteriaceae bacterium]
FISHNNYYFKIIFSVFDLIAIYWIFYHGIRQRNVLTYLSDSREFAPLPAPLNSEPSASNMAIGDLHKLSEKIEGIMMSNESFAKKDLTIIELAEKLDEHPKRISVAINTVFNQNFNSYVNGLRVKKAISLLNNNKLNHLSIEGLGKEVGFHSKSAFYAAFRKSTGTTPANFAEKEQV